MEPGFEVCPKCNGKGIMKCKVWDSRSIVWNLFRVKKIREEKRLGYNRMIEIICPGCDGSGKIAWTEKATRGETLIRPFGKLEGNMDIYHFQAANLWPIFCKTHQYRSTGTNYYSEEIAEKAIKQSQKRYRGIKLNPKVLSISWQELRTMSKLVDEYEEYLRSLPAQEINEEVIKTKLTELGLGEFMPDKFVLPGPDDYPT